MTRRSEERRRHERHAVVCPVTVFDGGEEIPVTAASADLSDGGMYLTVPADLRIPVRSRVDLTFCLAREPDRPEVYATSARVVRRVSQGDKLLGLGVRFKRAVRLELS